MKIEHIAIYVSNLEKTRDFFIKYFNAKSNDGYHNQTTDFRSYFLSFDGGARLEIMNRPELSPNQNDLPSVGYAHAAFSVGNKERVDEITKRLKADGYSVTSGPRTTGDGYYESCVVCMDDIAIEITE